MDRASALDRLEGEFDILVIGGGATGLGAAVDAVTRGYRTALVTSGDFAQGTSSRSTKLIHGGVRYLEQGDVTLVRDSLRERALLLRNAPNLVHELRFVIPAYRWWQIPYFGAGLKAYDLLAGGTNLTSSGPVGRARALGMAPTLNRDGLKGGIAYSDAQFDDARLALALARTAHAHGAVLATYAQAVELLKERGRITGARIVDTIGLRELVTRARVVVNATGIFTDEVRRLDDPASEPILRFSHGSHIVVASDFLPGPAAVLVPRTEDGRVIFIIPWEGHTLIGTTDIHVDSAEVEPLATEEEIAFLLEHAARYLETPPGRVDVQASFAGIRPLVQGNAQSTARLSRDHTLLVSDAGLVTITGGKWTTYRHMAEDTVDAAARVGALTARPSVTSSLQLAGARSTDPRWRDLGATGEEIFAYEGEYTGMLHPDLPHSLAMAAYVIDREMPVNLDDVLSRRLRALVLNSAAALEAAPAVARLMASKQGKDEAWIEDQLDCFRTLAERAGAAVPRAESDGPHAKRDPTR